MPATDLNDMLFFAEVAERGGFAAAGRVLRVPKSRLSRRVAELEQSLGVQLLQRSTRQLSLTPAGELYLRHCIVMRDAAAGANEAIAQMQGVPQGIVRISCPVTLARTSVGPLLLRYMALYPQVRIEMRLIDRPVNLIEEGLDIAVRIRSTIEDSTSLVAKRLHMIRPLLVISPTQLAQQGPVHDLTDIARLDTLDRHLVPEGRSTWRLKDPDGHIHTVQHTPRYVAEDIPLLKSAVLQGLGAVMLADYMIRDELSSGQLVEVLPGWEGLSNIVYALFSPRRALMPAVRKLIDFLADHLAVVSPNEPPEIKRA